MDELTLKIRRWHLWLALAVLLVGGGLFAYRLVVPSESHFKSRLREEASRYGWVLVSYEYDGGTGVWSMSLEKGEAKADSYRTWSSPPDRVYLNLGKGKFAATISRISEASYDIEELPEWKPRGPENKEARRLLVEACGIIKAVFER